MPNAILRPHPVFSKSQTRAQSISLAVHGGLLAVLLIPALASPPEIRGPRDTWVVFPGMSKLAEWKAEVGSGKKDSGGGGGGEHNLSPARQGGIPPFTLLQVTPPGRPQPDAELLAPPTLVGPELVIKSLIKLPLGDPNSKSLLDSLGPGSNGVGDGKGGGVGPGDGPGLGDGEGGWTGGETGIRIAGRGVGMPVCSFCPNPTFTDEAIHAKRTGAVLLRLVVTADGRATNISVMRSVGYGLDERACDAVATWRFTPSRDPAGRPVAAWVTIEVQFHQF